MNDRINNLWEEAKVMLVEWRLSPKMEKKIPSIMEEDYFIREKFAELIVKECASRCEFVALMADITNTGEMARKTKATADSCATMIKEHFGIKE